MNTNSLFQGLAVLFAITAFCFVVGLAVTIEDNRKTGTILGALAFISGVLACICGGLA